MLLPLLAALPAAPLSAIIVSNGPLELHEAVRAESLVGNVSDVVVRTYFPGLLDFPSAESLVQFPKGIFNQPVFSSALTEESGNIEVGVDNLGDHIDDPVHGSSTLTATSTYVVQIVNNSDDPLQIRFALDIPGGTIVLRDPEVAADFHGASGEVHVEIHSQIGFGPAVEEFVYGARMSIVKDMVSVTPKGPIEFHETLPQNFTERAIAIEPLHGEVAFPEIPPHQTLLFTYVMTAHSETLFPETGSLAKLGDPLDGVAGTPPKITVVKSGVSPQALVVDPASGSASDGNGVLEPGETVRVEPAWQNSGDAAVALTGSGETPGGPAGPTYTTNDDGGAYGTILPQATQSCTATDDCYAVTVSGARPAPHWDATFPETIEPGTVPKTWRLHLGDSFSDVPRSQPFYKKIETVFHHGITQGCTPTQFCPGDDVSRAQMAIFIARAIAAGQALPKTGFVGADPYDCSSGGVSVFTDVPPTDPACKAVHLVASQGVTTGCAPSLFCPTPSVTRAEMAIFLAKAIVAPNGGTAVPVTYGPDPATGLSYSCDAASPNLHFTDVSVADSFCKHVHFLWARGDVSGCSPTTYCPGDAVARDQMAKFLANAFELKLYGP